MRKRLTAKKAMTYATRRLRPGDEFLAKQPDARVLVAIGKAAYAPRATKPTPHPKPVDPDDEIRAVRAEYRQVVGKQAFWRWGIDQLREKIAAAKG